MTTTKKTLFCLLLFIQAILLISMNEAYGYFATAILAIAFALIDYVILKK